jgi:hypothetical protein
MALPKDPFWDDDGAFASFSVEELAERGHQDADVLAEWVEEVMVCPFIARKGRGKWTVKLVVPEEA